MRCGFRQAVFELDGARRGATVKVGADGRILIPASIRKAVGLKAGGMANLRMDGDRLVIEDPSAPIRRIRAAFAAIDVDGGSLTDDFLKGRRAMWGDD
ncbi:AbrB/MazE/SpoVT family DNA-binding domain-containing protein [Jannaschia sp. LMIT008]|uniref:AbrB/MazE/SpoVT family DNA-binding domain-containing protein n=1 Tax=Jannaschia maritima TaxID=3032585 RepID=UPI002810D397|nr:AbrB/MazE/SpoVT family DNA-binding domain-containing protein [Jannaschia sp. LMIT008]